MSADVAPPPGVPDLAWRVCTSPIEKALLRGFVQAAPGVRAVLNIVTDLREVTSNLHGVVVVPQCKVCNHTVDFLVCLGALSIAVECDGQRWHSRADQSRHDRAVDRALQRAGYRVYRFTGEDIWKNAAGCAETVLADLLQWATGVPGTPIGSGAHPTPVTSPGGHVVKPQGPSDGRTR